MKNGKKNLVTLLFGLLMVTVILLLLLLGEKHVISEETAKVYSEDEINEMLGEVRTEAVEQGKEEVLSEIKTSLDSGSSILGVLRPYYPDDVVLVSGNAYHFVPILDTIDHNRYEQENLEISENGEYRYWENSEVVSHKVIDVSSHQGTIDWEKVAGDGVEFVFIRAVYRGYGTGKLVEDERFDENMEGAMAAGIPAGLYVYTQAINEKEVLEEANLAIQKASAYTDRCPIVVDVERVIGSDARMDRLSVEERTRLVKLFCETVEEAGYIPIIYHNLEMGIMLLDLEELQAYDKWFAAYTDTFYYPYDYQIWQYSEKGTVEGISGDVDMNISFSAFWE